MNTEATKTDWAEIKSKIKTRFGKLTDENIDSMKGNLDLLSTRLQSVYGYAREQADREFTGFKTSLHPATEPVKKPAVEEVKPSLEQVKKIA